VCWRLWLGFEFCAPIAERLERHGVERWLGELALALREESYQPDPIRRVFIPKANGKLGWEVGPLLDASCPASQQGLMERGPTFVFSGFR
jgi:hypothetical protein